MKYRPQALKQNMAEVDCGGRKTFKRQSDYTKLEVCQRAAHFILSQGDQS